MESRVIKITETAFKYGNLNLSACGRDFFPSDVFGGPKKNQPGKLITLKIDGMNDTIETDIPTDKKTGHPRWLFRKRGWVRKFIFNHKLNSRDTIIIAHFTLFFPKLHKRCVNRFYFSRNGLLLNA